MSEFKATLGRPKKYDFDEWLVDEPQYFKGLETWHKARASAYQYKSRSVKEFSAWKENNGGWIVRIK